MGNVTAQYLELGLELDICSVEDVTKWVDRQALSSSELNGALLELTYLENGSPLDVISLLSRIPKEEEYIAVLVRLLGDIPEQKKMTKASARI